MSARVIKTVSTLKNFNWKDNKWWKWIESEKWELMTKSRNSFENCSIENESNELKCIKLKTFVVVRSVSRFTSTENLFVSTIFNFPSRFVIKSITNLSTALSLRRRVNQFTNRTLDVSCVRKKLTTQSLSGELMKYLLRWDNQVRN